MDKKYFIPILIFLVIFLVNLMCVLFIFPKMNLLPSPDFTERYESVAKNLINRSEFSIIAGKPTARISPLYPFLISLIYVLFGQGQNIIRIFFVIVNAFTCILIYLIGNKLFNKKIAIFTAFALGFYPPFIYLVGVLTTEAVFALLISFFILYFLKALDFLSSKYIFVSGIMLGLAALCRATILFFPFFIFIGFVIVFKKDFKYITRKLLILLLGMSLIICPWIVRNYLVFHKFIPIQTSGGRHLFYGTSREILLAKGVESTTEAIIQEREKFGLHEKAVKDKEFFKAGLNRIIEHPLDYLKLIPLKFLKFWGGTDSGKWDNLLVPLQLILLGFSILGFLLSLEQWKKTIFLAAIIIYFIIIHMIGYPLARHSMPIIPFILLFATNGVYQICKKFFDF